MTKREIIMLFGAITNLFPNDKRFAAADANMRDAWHDLLQDIDFQLASKAVAACAATKDFPPTIAEIRRMCVKTTGESAEQAWARVLAALKDSGYHSAERFAELPPICQKLVGSPSVLKEWATTEDSTGLSVARTRFMAHYDIERRREAERMMIPESVRLALDAALNTNLIGEGEST